MSRIHLQTIQDIFPLYDAFIIDLWGVVHNGVHPFKFSKQTLKLLKANKKTILFLTNAQRRITVLKKQLFTMGIADHLYDYLWSSGESVYHLLEQSQNESHSNSFKICYYIGPLNDQSIIEGLPLVFTEDPKKANFVLATAPRKSTDILDLYKKELETLVKEDLLLICPNPDITAIRGDQEIICAGSLAKYYEEIKGKVDYRGKPHRAIYEQCFNTLKIPKHRICAIGDTFHTDIIGAKNNDMDTIFITSGIHGKFLNSQYGDHSISTENINLLCETYATYPNYLMTAFF